MSHLRFVGFPTAVACLVLGLASTAQGQILSGKLVYTSVQSCRVVDTRHQAAGRLAKGEARAFNVVGTASNFAGQGGKAAGCALPGFANGKARVQAVMLNFVAVQPAGAGFLRAWASDDPEPDTSILNFAALSGLNLANAIVLPVRQDVEGNDITVRVEGTGTHLVADVVGFFSKASPRRYYQSIFSAVGNTALTTCAPGFHMASLWEIFDTSVLEYDTTLGAPADDSGFGPPTTFPAWIRTGAEAGFIAGGHIAGLANCNAWTSGSGADNGTVVDLGVQWANSPTAISPWFAFTMPCSTSNAVWCVEDL